MPWSLRTPGVLPLLLCACGPNVPVEDTGNADETSPTSDPSESGTTDPGTDTLTSGIDTGPSCEGFEDERGEIAPTVFEIRNEGIEPVLLPMPCGLDYLTVTSEQDWRWPGGWCTDTCENQFQYGCSVCDGCASAAYIRIDPGGFFRVEWRGFLYEDVSAPEACFTQGVCAETCPRLRLPSPETLLEVTVVAATLADCEAVESDPSDCACMVNDEGWCDFYGNESAPITLEATTTFTFAPGPEPISIVFQ